MQWPSCLTHITRALAAFSDAVFGRNTEEEYRGGIRYGGAPDIKLRKACYILLIIVHCVPIVHYSWHLDVTAPDEPPGCSARETRES